MGGRDLKAGLLQISLHSSYYLPVIINNKNSVRWVIHRDRNLIGQCLNWVGCNSSDLGVFAFPIPAIWKARIAKIDFGRRSRRDFQAINVKSTGRSTSSPTSPGKGCALATLHGHKLIRHSRIWQTFIATILRRYGAGTPESEHLRSTGKLGPFEEMGQLWLSTNAARKSISRPISSSILRTEATSGRSIPNPVIVTLVAAVPISSSPDICASTSQVVGRVTP